MNSPCQHQRKCKQKSIVNMDADARCIRVKHFISEESNNTYSVYVKEKVVITVVQSLE